MYLYLCICFDLICNLPEQAAINYNNVLWATMSKAWSPYSRKDRKHGLATIPKEHLTAPRVSIAIISYERLLLSKTCFTM